MKQTIYALTVALMLSTQLLAVTIPVTQANFAGLSPLQPDTTYLFNENIDASSIAPTSAFFADGISNVTIDLNGFTLTLTEGQTGIQINNSNPGSGLNTNIAIKNGIITANQLAVGANSNGITATYFNGITIENMGFQNTRRGFTAADQLAENKNLNFSSCTFNLPSDANIRGIALGTIIGLRVTDCTFLPTSSNLNVNPAHILLINNARDIVIKRSTFGSCGSAFIVQSADLPPGFRFQFPSKNVTIDTCEFNGEAFQTIISQASNTQIKNSTFTLSSYAGPEDIILGIVFSPATSNFAVVGPVPQGLLIENCNLELKNDLLDLPITAGISLGENVKNGAVSNVIIRNSSVIQGDAPAMHSDLVALQVHGLLIENSIFDSNSTGRDTSGNPIISPFTNLPIKSANITLGQGSEDDSIDLFVSDVVIRNSTCKGGAQAGIFVDNGANTVQNARISIEDSTITATEIGIGFNNTTCSRISNSCVKKVLGSPFASGVGIQIAGPLSYNPTAKSTFNTIAKSIIKKNAYGLVIEPGATCNTVKHNKIVNNKICQMSADKKHNKIKDNKISGTNSGCSIAPILGARSTTFAATKEEATKTTAQSARTKKLSRE